MRRTCKIPHKFKEYVWFTLAVLMWCVWCSKFEHYGILLQNVWMILLFIRLWKFKLSITCRRPYILWAHFVKCWAGNISNIFNAFYCKNDFDIFTLLSSQELAFYGYNIRCGVTGMVVFHWRIFSPWWEFKTTQYVLPLLVHWSYICKQIVNIWKGHTFFWNSYERTQLQIWETSNTHFQNLFKSTLH